MRAHIAMPARWWRGAPLSLGPVATALAAVLALHGLALWGGAGLLKPMAGGAAPVGKVTVMRVSLGAARALQPAVAGTAPAVPGLAVDRSGSTPAAESVAGATASPDAGPGARARPGEAAVAAAPMPPDRTPVDYLDTALVDEPARPVQQWALDAEDPLLDTVRRLVVELDVNARGAIDRCAVLGIEPPPPDGIRVAEALQGRLQATPMLPARRGGQAVGNRLRVELILDRD